MSKPEANQILWRALLSQPTSPMPSFKTRALLTGLPPLLHLCACVVIVLGHIDVGWEYLGFVDIPASILVMGISYNFDHPFILFGIIGTFWWWVLGQIAEIVASKLLIRRTGGNQD